MVRRRTCAYQVVRNVSFLEIFAYVLNEVIPYKFNPLKANIIKWSDTLKKFVGKLPTNCLSVFDHFVGLVLKVLRVQ